jgi:hypothetical protein
MTAETNDPPKKATTPSRTEDADTAAATEHAAAEVPEAVDRAGDTTPTKPGSEASKASSGLADHSKHPPGERAENAAIAVSGSSVASQE